MKPVAIWILILIPALNAAYAFKPAHVQQVKAGQDCQQCDLRNANLEGTDLRGLNLANAWMTNANLKGANLEGAKLDYATLSAANLEGANLKKTSAFDTKFLGTNLRGVSFDGADLTKADFGPGKWWGQQYPKADVAGASFSGAKLKGVKGLPASATGQPTKRRGSAKDTRKRLGKMPTKDFLANEIYVIAGGSPMAGAFSVHQIVGALGSGKKSWAAYNPGQWMLTFKKKHRKTGKRLNLKMLFTKHNDDSGEGVLMARVIANGQELNKGQIFQFMQQLALKAEAKQ